MHESDKGCDRQICTPTCKRSLGIRVQEGKQRALHGTARARSESPREGEDPLGRQVRRIWGGNDALSLSRILIYPLPQFSLSRFSITLITITKGSEKRCLLDDHGNSRVSAIPTTAMRRQRPFQCTGNGRNSLLFYL